MRLALIISASALAIGSALYGITLLMIADASAHQIPGMDAGISYPPSCCNSAATSPTGDCAPIDDQYVTEEADGYHVNLPVGAHPRLIHKGYVGVIPYEVARKQPLDNRYHICLATDGAARYCFFPKPGSV